MVLRNYMECVQMRRSTPNPCRLFLIYLRRLMLKKKKKKKKGGLSLLDIVTTLGDIIVMHLGLNGLLPDGTNPLPVLNYPLEVAWHSPSRIIKWRLALRAKPYVQNTDHFGQAVVYCWSSARVLVRCQFVTKTYTELMVTHQRGPGTYSNGVHVFMIISRMLL